MGFLGVANKGQHRAQLTAEGADLESAFTLAQYPLHAPPHGLFACFPDKAACLCAQPAGLPWPVRGLVAGSQPLGRAGRPCLTSARSSAQGQELWLLQPLIQPLLGRGCLKGKASSAPLAWHHLCPPALLLPPSPSGLQPAAVRGPFVP